MAAKRTKSRLAPGTTIEDYASGTRIWDAFQTESAIRAEYSRQRSIIRKRVERMKAAGETSNWLYDTFGDLETAMPSIKGLSTETAMRIMASSARALSGAYQSTLGEVRKSREDAVAALIKAAEKAGDLEAAAVLKTGVTSAEWAKVNRAMGMITSITGHTYDSDQVKLKLTEVTKTSDPHRSILSLAAQVINDLGLGDEDALEKLKERYTASGKTRVSWSKAHKNRK